MSAIKNNAPEGAKNQSNYNPYYLTMQISAVNSPLEERMLQRKIKRSKMIRRRELAKQIARYTFGIGMLIVLWIVMTGMFR